jgi:hypothetical protein
MNFPDTDPTSIRSSLMILQIVPYSYVTPISSFSIQELYTLLASNCSFWRVRDVSRGLHLLGSPFGDADCRSIVVADGASFPYNPMTIRRDSRSVGSLNVQINRYPSLLEECCLANATSSFRRGTTPNMVLNSSIEFQDPKQLSTVEDLELRSASCIQLNVMVGLLLLWV